MLSPPGDVPAFRFAAAVLVLLPVAWARGHVGEWRHGRLLVFALCLVTMPLIAPLGGGHRLVVVVGALWIWLLAVARWPIRWPDAAGSAIFLVANWQGNSPRGWGFPVGALLVLYVLLLAKIARPTSTRVQAASVCA